MSRAFLRLDLDLIDAEGYDVAAVYDVFRWHADRGPWVASTEQIMEAARLTRNRVLAATKRLRHLGLVASQNADYGTRTQAWSLPDTKSRSGTYKVPIQDFAPIETSRPTTTPLPPAAVELDEGDLVAFPGNGEPMTAQPSPADVPFALDVPGLPSLPARRADGTAEAFARFWEHYPRRVGKQAAQRAFEKAVRAGVEPAVILWGLSANEAALQAQHARGFCPHPTTWLNAGRWEDDPEAVAPRQHGRSDPMMDLVREGIARNGGLDEGSQAILATLMPRTSTPPRLALGDSA